MKGEFMAKGKTPKKRKTSKTGRARRRNKKLKKCRMTKENGRIEVSKVKKNSLFIETTPAAENTKTVTYQALKGWGDDSFTKLLYNAHFNILTTHAKLRLISSRLKAIHDAFETILEYSKSIPDVSFNHFMLHRTHSAYLAGFRLSTSGQCSDSSMVLR